MKYQLILVSVVAHTSLISSGWAQTFQGSVPLDFPPHGTQNCLPGVSLDELQRCDKAVSDQLNASSQTTVLDGGWRLVKTKDPGGHGEVVSAMRTVDTAKSDMNLAGMSLNCASGGIQITLIMLSHLPRANHPKVILTAGPTRSEFEASVTQSGEALLLPQAATRLASGDWQNASELSIEIATKSNPVKGIVPISGLSSALRSLSPNCLVK